MEKGNVFELISRIKYLESQIVDLQNEIYKRDCLSRVDVSSNKKNNKSEIIQSLGYLKNKKEKTKQDKESIYTLEMILRNMK
jgi:hypothetical protein